MRSTFKTLTHSLEINFLPRLGSNGRKVSESTEQMIKETKAAVLMPLQRYDISQIITTQLGRIQLIDQTTTFAERQNMTYLMKFSI